MLKIPLADNHRTLGISFSHLKRVSTLAPLLTATGGTFSPAKAIIRSVECSVFDVLGVDETKLISKSTVTCYYKDRFTREMGRKQALRRALFYTNLTKAERSLVWEGYHRRGTTLTEAVTV